MKFFCIVVGIMLVSGCVTRKRMFHVAAHWAYYGYQAGEDDIKMKYRGYKIERTAEKYLEHMKKLGEELQ